MAKEGADLKPKGIPHTQEKEAFLQRKSQRHTEHFTNSFIGYPRSS